MFDQLLVGLSPNIWWVYEIPSSLLLYDRIMKYSCTVHQWKGLIDYQMLDSHKKPWNITSDPVFINEILKYFHNSTLHLWKEMHDEKRCNLNYFP